MSLPSLPRTLAQRTVPSDEEHDDSRILPELMPSAVAALADVPFDAMDANEIALLGKWLESSMHRWPMRRSRRTTVSDAGHRIALRETMREARRTGWEPVSLRRHRQVLRPMPVVLITDVSQSMRDFATAYLHMMRAFAQTQRCETFAFSTSLTRLTPTLALRSAEQAIERATDEVVDRYGGTHLATSLSTMLRSRHGNALRGGVLVIASDGWDSDPPEMLAAVMARARRRARRVVWLNPRAAARASSRSLDRWPRRCRTATRFFQGTPSARCRPCSTRSPGALRRTQPQSVTCTAGLKRPRFTPEPRTIACVARGVVNLGHFKPAVHVTLWGSARLSAPGDQHRTRPATSRGCPLEETRRRAAAPRPSIQRRARNPGPRRLD